MTDRLRVVVVTGARVWGGAEQQVATLLQALPDAVDARLVGVDRGVMTRLGGERSGSARIVDAAQGTSDLRAFRAARRAVRAARPDVVHVNLSWTAGERTLLLAALASGAPVVVVDHLPQPVPTAAGAVLARLLARRVRSYVTVSPSAARTAEEVLRLRAGSVHVVPNGVVLPPLSPQPARGGTRIACVARLERRKGVELLLDAVARLPGTALDIAGEGPEGPALRARAQRLGITDRVRLLGHVDDPARLLAQADVFALPSRAEGLPLALLEAMAAGVPVVASSVGGVPDLVVHGDTGLLIPPGDVDALVSSLRRVLSDRALAERLGSAGRALVADRYSGAAMGEGYVELWRRAAASSCRVQSVVARLAATGPALPPVPAAAATSLVVAPPPARVREPAPAVSVVIATVGRTAQLERCVRSVLTNRHSELEVLVVDDAPVAGAAQSVVTSLEDVRVRVLRTGGRGASAARNAGAAAARSALLAFTDDDITVDENWVGALAARCTATGSGAVTGLTLPLQLSSSSQIWFERFAGFGRGLHAFTLSATSTHGVPRLWPYSVGNLGGGGNLLVRSELFHRLGGFDERLGPGTATFGGEDLELLCRVLLAGASVAYEPAAMVWHEHRRDESAVRLQAFTYGAGLTAQLAAHAGDPRFLRRLVRTSLPVARTLVRGRPAPATTASGLTDVRIPQQLRRRELVGYLYGPFGLWHSARHHRRRPG